MSANRRVQHYEFRIYFEIYCKTSTPVEPYYTGLTRTMAPAVLDEQIIINRRKSVEPDTGILKNIFLSKKAKKLGTLSLCRRNICNSHVYRMS